MKDYRLFEYVFVDPKAAFDSPVVFESLGMSSGYIMIFNKNIPFGKQLEKEVPECTKNKRDYILNIISNLRKRGWASIEEEFTENKDSHLPIFLDNAHTYSVKENYKALCIVSDENLGKATQKKEISVYNFVKRALKIGKSPKLPMTPEAFAQALYRVFHPSIFAEFVKFITIIDPYVDKIGEKPDTYLKRRRQENTLQTIEKICKYLSNIFEKEIIAHDRNNNVDDLEFNIILQIKKNGFTAKRFTDRFEEYMAESEIGFFRGKKRRIKLNFVGLEETGKERVHLRWTFSNSFLIYHHDGVCSTREKKKDHSEVAGNIWQLMSLLDDDDIEFISTEEENNSHATLDKFKKMYHPKTKYFDPSFVWSPKLFYLSSNQISDNKEVATASA